MKINFIAECLIVFEMTTFECGPQIKGLTLFLFYGSLELKQKEECNDLNIVMHINYVVFKFWC